MQNAIVRVPALEEMGVVKLINGPEAFTPDGEFILGPSDLRGLLGRGRLLRARPRRRRRDGKARRRVDRRGHAVARRLAHGLAAVRRRVPVAAAHARTDEGDLRDLLRREVPRARARGGPAAARVGRVSAARRARRRVRREVRLGARELVRAERGRAATSRCARAAGPGSSGRPRSARSTRRAARAAALFDESSFAKIDVSGDGAAAFLEGLCANRVARDVGRVTYTQMLNARGGIECDFTVTRLADDRFRIVTGTAFGQHDLAWIRQHAPDDGSVHVADVTSQYACLGLWGPESRAILQPLTTRRPRERGVPVHDAHGSSRSARCRASPCASRTSGSSAGSSTARPSTASGSGTPSGRRPGRRTGSSPGGYKAIDSLRLEKGYRVWGADISPEDTPFEAGLGFAVKLDKEFVGRDALEARARPRAPAALPRPRRSAGDRPRLGAGPRRRRAGRPGDERRLRLHGRPRRSRTPISRPSTTSEPRWPSRSSEAGSTAS